MNTVRGEKTQKIRELISKYKQNHGAVPDHEEASAIVKHANLKVSKNYLYKLLADASTGGNRSGKATVVRSGAMNRQHMTISIPDNGLAIKLQIKQRMVGTLIIEQEGFSFIKENGRIVDRQITWAVATKLMESGLLG